MEKNNGLRVILFPLPLQGCINPMVQLAKILHSRGFSITVIHTRFNAPKASDHPLFTFLQISDDLSEAETKTRDINLLLTLLNRNCESPFRDCLTQLLQSVDSESEGKKERIRCLIDDAGWIFTQPLAQSLNLSRLALNTYKISFFRSHFVLPQLRRERYLHLQEDSEQDDPVQEFLPLRKKDLLQILKAETEALDSYTDMMLETTKASSGLIFISSCEELDQDSLSQARDDFKVPIFATGPSHIYFPGSSSSLFTTDETCLPWLDKQQERSVIYVSFGSIDTITESEMLEIAWGLVKSDQPFLWVVRVDLVINATQWLEAIPEELITKLNEKGKIVKWARQQEVLKHSAIGGFLTHNGWNSTVESVCEGVPMICLPFRWDQLLNARFVSEVWMVGIHLEGRIERNEIKRVIRRLLLETEGEAIRERMKFLKEKVERSVKPNGSAFQSLQHLIDYISSL